MTDKINEPDAQKSEDESSNGVYDVKPDSYFNDVEPGDQHEAVVSMSELRKVRAEAAKYRKELQSLKSRLDEERRQSELSKLEETERLRTIAAGAENEVRMLKERFIRTAKEAAIINTASALGFHNPKDAVSIIDTSQIEIDENGVVDDENVLSVVKALIEQKPYLRKEDSSIAYGPTNPPPQRGNWPRPKLTTANQVEQLKQQSRELTRLGRVAEATKLYNRAWEIEQGLRRKVEN